MTATTARRHHEDRVVELTALRVQLDTELAERTRLRNRVQAYIDDEVALLARAGRASRGLRCSLGELVDALAESTTTTQEGHD